MKRFFSLFALLCILFLPSCVEEYPEPLYNPEKNEGEEKAKLHTEIYAGVFYDFYNDMTAEASYYDSEQLGTATEIPNVINGYRVVKIKDECFRGSKIAQITLPEGLIEIGDRAFYQTSLSAITLPNSLQRIGNEAFDNCRLLKSIQFGSGLETIGTAAFYGCNLITELDLSRGVKVIGEEAFASLSNLKKLLLPENLEEIGPYAFFASGKESLETKIPKGVKKIGHAAFEGTGLEKTFTEEWVIEGDGVLLRYNGTEKNPTLPEEVKYLAWDFGKNGIEGLTLSDSLEGICPEALENLKKIPLEYKGSNSEIQALLAKDDTL